MNDESPTIDASEPNTQAAPDLAASESVASGSAAPESASESFEANHAGSSLSAGGDVSDSSEETPPLQDRLHETEAEGSPASAAEAVVDAEVAPVPDEKPVKKAKSRSKKKAASETSDSLEETGAEQPPSEASMAEESAVEAPASDAAPVALAVVESKKHWYIIKVTSNREDSIKSAVERRVKIEGLEEFFGQIVIPVERVTQVKKVVEKKKDTGEKVTKEKRVTKETKKYPGYLFAEVEFNDRILYLFRETSGVGDFVGASLNRAPTPMPDREVQAMLHNIVDPKDKKGGKTVVKLDFEKGDKVRIREGAFANSEGDVKLITEPKDANDTPKVTVVVTIWGRPVDVELDYWQVDKV